MNQDDQIKYWATMLNEAMCDKTIDERDFRPSDTNHIQPEDGIFRVKNLTDMLGMMKGNANFTVNVCISGGADVISDNISIIGVVNGASEVNGRCEITLAPYINGRRRKDCSVTQAPVMKAAEIANILATMPPDSEIVVKMRDPLKLGPNANKPVLVKAIGGKVTNGAYSGVFVIVDLEQQEMLNERRMSGPAAAARGGVDEIAEFRGQLAAGVVEFEFTKADGTRRHAIGTTNEQVVPTAERRRLDPDYDENLASYERRQAYIIWFWDLEKNECRCFNTNRFEGIVHFEPTNRHVDMNVDRIGNIFIHRDVDVADGANAAAPLTDDRAGQINNEIRDMIAANNPEITQLFGGGLHINDTPNIEVEFGPQNEPILRIEIRKHGSKNDQPYQLRINELRRAISIRWNVDVRKVIVDGEFTF